MPYVYQRTPFDPSVPPVYVVGLRCNSSHPGSRDIGFTGINWQRMQTDNNNNPIFGNDGRIIFNGTGTPIYAVESGRVVYLNYTTTCWDNNSPATSCPEAHGIAVKGNDGYYTLYAHVYPVPGLQMGSTVQQGTLLGYVDNSGNTTGPHLHFARFAPNLDPNDHNVWNNGTCDWTMNGLVPLNRTGWVQKNGKYYYFINGRARFGGWQQVGDTYYQIDSTGAWTGWALYQGSYYFWNGTSWERR